MNPSAPVHLLQDLAQRQVDTTDLELQLPTPDQIADIAPLPLSIPVLLRYGIIPLDAIDEAQRSEVQAKTNGSFDPASTSGSSQPSNSIIQSRQSTLDHLAKLSIDAGTLIKETCTTIQRDGGEEDWKTRLTFRDLWRVFALLEERLNKQGQGFMLAASDT